MSFFTTKGLIMRPKDRSELRKCRKLLKGWLKTMKEKDEELDVHELLLLEIILDGFMRTVKDIRLKMEEDD